MEAGMDGEAKKSEGRVLMDFVMGGDYSAVI